jgi:hypothetical protein
MRNDTFIIDRPIFVIGTGRCGSTIVFEALTLHDQLGWLSNYNARFPRLEFASLAPRIYDLPLRLPRGEKRQFRQGRSLLNRFLPKPEECYDKWEAMCGRKFRDDYLRGVRATRQEEERVRHAVTKALRYQNKTRFAAKITGPSRMTYLSSIFPDAQFVHVIRDGRAVVNSWLNVDFWQSAGAFDRPFWKNGLAENWQEEWARYNQRPAALAAMQYRTIIELSRQEKAQLANDQYIEITYEDFVRDPVGAMSQIFEFLALDPSPRVEGYLAKPGRYKSMDRKYLEAFSLEDLLMLDAILGKAVPRTDGPRPALQLSRADLG